MHTYWKGRNKSLYWQMKQLSVQTIPKNLPKKKLLQLLGEFSKVTDCNVNMQELIAMNNWNLKFKNTIYNHTKSLTKKFGII